MTLTKQEIQETLENIKAGKGISWGEIQYLVEHQDFIKEQFPDEPLLWEWAGIPEEEWQNR